MSFPIAAQGITAQFKPVGTVDKPVEDRIGDGGLCDLTVPFGHRQVAGDDFGLTGQAIIEDFEEVASAGGIKRCQAPIVENDHIGPIEVLIECGDGAFAMRDTQITEPAWQAQMHRLDTFETGFVGQGAGNPCLARSTGAGDEDIRTLADPAAIGEGEHDAAIEATWASPVNIFETGIRAAQPGAFEAPLSGPRLARGDLSLHQPFQTRIKGHVGEILAFYLFTKRCQHAWKAP